MHSEYGFFTFMVIVSLGLHTVLAYNLDMRPRQGHRVPGKPSVIPEISLRYISRKAPAAKVLRAEPVKAVRTKPVIKNTAAKPEPAEKAVKKNPPATQAKIQSESLPAEEPAHEAPPEEIPSEPIQEHAAAPSMTAEQEIGAAKQTSPVGGVSEPVKPVISAADLEELRNTIRSSLVYPSAAKRMGWTGVVNVEIYLAAKGALKGVKIIRSSGYGALDKAVIKSINRSTPFSLEPEQGVTVNLSVRFTINGVEI